MATAIAYGCSHDIDEYWAKDIEKIFRDDYGFAVAEVRFHAHKYIHYEDALQLAALRKSST